MSFDEIPERESPPKIVYKYVVADRIDVLRNATIRFTPPMNTNDIFEVRQTFEMLAGPKMKEMFEEQARFSDVDAALVDAFKDTPLAGIDTAFLKQLYSSATGKDLEDTMRNALGSLLSDELFPRMNSPEWMESLLTKVGNDLICLSLTERFDSSPMWAHYAGNSTGFVIAFDTQNEFFQRGEDGELQGLHKIAYFDGKITELMDDPLAALISKQHDWAYEREWRLYLKSDQSSKQLQVGGETIHLVDFPKNAVQRVILGLRASEELESTLKSLLAADYPNASLTRLSADRRSASLTEMPLD